MKSVRLCWLCAVLSLLAMSLAAETALAIAPFKKEFENMYVKEGDAAGRSGQDGQVRRLPHR